METMTLERKNKKTGEITKTEYTPVNQRIIEFRTNPKYEGWSLTTEIVRMKDDFSAVLMKTTITDASGIVKATGFAFEEQTPGNLINATSLFENAETSAWGRALGNMGIFVEQAICSKEEVETAIAKQEQIKTKNPVPANSNNLDTITIKYGKYANKAFKDLNKDELRDVCFDNNAWLSGKAKDYWNVKYPGEDLDPTAELNEIADAAEDLPF